MKRAKISKRGIVYYFSPTTKEYRSKFAYILEGEEAEGALTMRKKFRKWVVKEDISPSVSQLTALNFMIEQNLLSKRSVAFYEESDRQIGLSFEEMAKKWREMW